MRLRTSGEASPEKLGTSDDFRYGSDAGFSQLSGFLPYVSKQKIWAFPVLSLDLTADWMRTSAQQSSALSQGQRYLNSPVIGEDVPR